MLSRRLIVLVCTFLSHACATPIENQADLYKRVDGHAPLHNLHHEDKIEDRYVVHFDDDHTLEDHYAHIGQNLSDTDSFHKMKYGYGAFIQDASLLTRIRTDPKVWAVDTGKRIFIPPYISTPTNETMPKIPQGPAPNPIAKRGTRTYKTNTNWVAPWGLQMISAGKKLASPPKDNGKYEYLANAGQGAWVYIIDSGYVQRLFMPDLWGNIHGQIRATLAVARSYCFVPREPICCFY